MRWDVKGGEHYIPKPGYEWYGTCWATTFQSWMEGTRPGWKWDTNIGTRLYVRCKSRGIGRLWMILHIYIAPGWRSDGTWKEVIQIYWNLDSGLTGSAWSSDAHLETCMSLKCWLDGSQMQFCGSGSDGAEMPFCGPGWRWVATKMEVKRKYQGLNLVETRPRWRGEINLGAWLEVRCKSWDLAEGEMGHGLSWDCHLETWIRYNGTTYRIQLAWPGLRWDMTWIVVRGEYRDLDGRGKGEGEMRIFVI